MQKYQKGDHVQVAKDLGKSMSHFTSDCEAIVIGSYVDQYGGNHVNSSYTIHIKGKGRTSWYYEHQLDLIAPNRLDLLEQWEQEAKQEAEKKSDLDWIFKHGDEVLLEASGATISALAQCFGLTNLWGSHGEGATYYCNVLETLALAEPFLKANDKEGWLDHCKTLQVECK